MIATHPCPYPDPRICNQPSNNTSEVAMNWIVFFGSFQFGSNLDNCVRKYFETNWLHFPNALCDSLAEKISTFIFIFILK